MTTAEDRARVGQDDLVEALTAARDQLHETGEILRALGRSASDLDHVMRTVTASSLRLFRSDAALVFLFDGTSFNLAWSAGLSAEFRVFVTEHPVRADREALVGRVGLDRRTQQIEDVLSDPEYKRSDLQRVGGYRTVIGAPMLVDDEVVGVLNLWRGSIRPFTDREAELLTTYAAQAAVAIRTAGLMRDLEQHKVALTRRLEQLEALSAVGESVSSSLDLDEVLTTIVTHAVGLAGADGGSILEFDEGLGLFRVRTTTARGPDPLTPAEEIRVGLDDTLVGRAAAGHRPLQAPDLAVVDDDPYLERLYAAGWRSVVAVPMLRRGNVVGALVIQRRTTGTVDEDTCDLLETFASQSSLALTNAQLYRRLEQQSDELAVASRHKSEFLASMSHELRTPLNAVIGFSEVLLERMFGDVNDRQAEYLGHIRDSGRHLLALLNDILDLSKVEAGQMVLEPGPVDVVGLLESTAGLVRERAQRRGLALAVTVDDGIPAVHADELRIRQVVLNLLTNAVKFTPEGGHVTVAAVARGDDVEVSVADDGVGIPDADQERIFESFQQGERVVGAPEGTGLGLTLSRRIVELHSGHLWVESEPGRGSTFRFTLPVHRTPALPVSAAGRHGPAVLLVEDDPRSSDLMTLLLGDQGFPVRVATSGEEALAALDLEVPAAVVLDIRLPGMDGWEVLARIKGQPALAHVPVIIVSILDEQGRGYALGADDYLVKPVARDLLVRSLHRVGLVPDRAGRHVWVVDADAGSRSSLGAELEQGGWTVLASASVPEGLEGARRRPPRVVIVDLVTVADDGFAAVRVLGTDPVLHGTPVVALAPDGADAATRRRLTDEVSVAATLEQGGVGDLLALLERVGGGSGSGT